MKLEHAEAIVEAAKRIGHEIALYKDYSGRGMHGKTTAGVVGSFGAIVQSIAQATIEIGDTEGGAAFIEDMGNLSKDNMGKYDIIVY